MPSIRILAVDDHPVVLSGLISVLSCQPDMEIVGQAVDGADALSKFDVLRPNVVLLDFLLPDMDGVELILTIKKRVPTTRFVILSAKATGDDINRSLQVGVQAYLFKDSPIDDVLNAIRMVADGGRYLPPVVGRTADQRPLTVDLTFREREIVVFLARGMNTNKISEKLKIAPYTVKSHVRNILDKLGLESRSEAVAHCLRMGVIRLDELKP